ncbi:MAG: cell cycle transcriptional regulator TrcR [Pseudomonadota bacterium]
MLLMPKATAVWLVENTALTFHQIAKFTGMHRLEVQAIADGDLARSMQGVDPTQNSQLTREEIARCEADPSAELKMITRTTPNPRTRSKGPRYTPVSKRGDKPAGIAWLVKNHPELLDSQISRLIGTTRPTITAIRERTHWNITNIRAMNPVELGLCSQAEITKEVTKSGGTIKSYTLEDDAQEEKLQAETPEKVFGAEKISELPEL